MPQTITRNAHWLLRGVVAAVFGYHGYTKFADGTMQAEMLGIPLGLVLLTGLAELGGASLIIFGGFGSDLATRLGGFAILPVMIGAIARFHWPQWSFVASDAHPMGGMEFQITLLALALFFVVTGNGALGGPRIEPSARPERIPANY